MPGRRPWHEGRRCAIADIYVRHGSGAPAARCAFRWHGSPFEVTGRSTGACCSARLGRTGQDIDENPPSLSAPVIWVGRGGDRCEGQHCAKGSLVLTCEVIDRNPASYQHLRAARRPSVRVWNPRRNANRLLVGTGPRGGLKRRCVVEQQCAARGMVRMRHDVIVKIAGRLPCFHGWVVVGVVFITMLFGVNARTAFSLPFPPILSEFGSARGVTAGAFSFGFLVSAELKAGARPADGSARPMPDDGTRRLHHGRGTDAGHRRDGTVASPLALPGTGSPGGPGCPRPAVRLSATLDLPPRQSNELLLETGRREQLRQAAFAGPPHEPRWELGGHLNNYLARS